MCLSVMPLLGRQAHYCSSAFSVTCRACLSGFVQISVVDEDIGLLIRVKLSIGFFSDRLDPFYLFGCFVIQLVKQMLKCGRATAVRVITASVPLRGMGITTECRVILVQTPMPLRGRAVAEIIEY